jgi:hypothetical protein
VINDHGRGCARDLSRRPSLTTGRSPASEVHRAGPEELGSRRHDRPLENGLLRKPTSASATQCGSRATAGDMLRILAGASQRILAPPRGRGVYLRKLRSGRDWLLPRARLMVRDAQQRAKHGPAAPRYAQRIWVDPRRLETGVLAKLDRSLSGSFIDGDWDRDRIPVRDFDIVARAICHWSEGISWEEVGAYEALTQLIGARGRSVEGCRSLDDVVARYARIDGMFDQMRAERRLRTRSSLPLRSFREEGGVVVHIGYDSMPLFGFGGCHRLAAALVLELPYIPAELTFVHQQAARTWPQQLLAVGNAPPVPGSGTRTGPESDVEG